MARISYIESMRASNAESQMSPTNVSMHFARCSRPILLMSSATSVRFPSSWIASISPWPTSPPAPVRRVAEFLA